jgi:hypothetical protein
VVRLEDWYLISSRSVAAHPHAASLLRTFYNSSLYVALRSLYPEHDWQPWRFLNPPKHLWLNPHHIRSFLTYAAEKLKLSSVEEWKGVSWRQLTHLGAHRLSRQGLHLAQYLPLIHPDQEWDESAFVSMPPRAVWWAQHSHRLHIFNALRTALHLDPPAPRSGWYRVTSQQIRSSGVRHAAALLRFYHNNLCHLLIDLDPSGLIEGEWLPWLFQQLPPVWWKSAQNAQQWLGWVMLQMGFKSATELQSLTYRQWKLLRGRPLLGQHGESPLAMLQWALPQLNTQHWNLRYKSRGKTAVALSETIDAERAYLVWAARELSVSEWPADWYSVAYSDLARVAANRGGNHESIISQRYGFSLARALSHLFPEYSWDLSSFLQMERGRWDDALVQRQAMDRMSMRLFDISRPEDVALPIHLERWYSVTPDQISRLDCLDTLYMISRYFNRSITQCLFALYSEHAWVPSRFKYPSLRVYPKPPLPASELTPR